MRITVLTPIHTGVYQDDTQMFCDGLEKYHGHTVNRAELWYEKGRMAHKKGMKIDFEAIKNSDIIWAPYEPLVPAALMLKKEYGVPVLGHWEVIPQGRFELDKVDTHWGTTTKYPEEEHFYTEYKFLAEEFYKCDGHTTIGLSEKYKLERLAGRKLFDSWIKPYPMNDELLKENIIENPEQKNQVVCIIGLKPHKRPHHVIKAMSMVTNAPKLIFVGEGPLMGTIKEYAKELKVDVEFTGRITDKEKFKIIQESKFLVQPWVALPVSEAAYYKKASISYDDPFIRDRLMETPFYCECNNIKDMAGAIVYLIDNPDIAKKIGENAHNEFVNGGTHTYFLKQASEILNKHLECTILKAGEKNE